MPETSSSQRDKWFGVLALLLTASMWSLNGPLIKILNAGGAGVSGVAIAFYRSVIGGVVFAPMAWRLRGSMRAARPRWHVASILSFTLMTAAFVIATTLTAAANAIILQYSAPVWVVLLGAVFLGERLRRAEAAILTVAMAGVVVIFLGNPVTDRVGLTIALASGFGYGALLVTLRGLRRVNPVVVVCMNSLGSAALLAPAVLVWSTFALSGRQFGLVVLLSVVQFAIPYALYSWAARHVEANRASLIVLVEAVLNPLWTYLAVGEAVPHATLRGGPIILLSVVGWMLYTWRVERQDARTRRFAPPDVNSP